MHFLSKYAHQAINSRDYLNCFFFPTQGRCERLCIAQLSLVTIEFGYFKWTRPSWLNCVKHYICFEGSTVNRIRVFQGQPSSQKMRNIIQEIENSVWIRVLQEKYDSQLVYIIAKFKLTVSLFFFFWKNACTWTYRPDIKFTEKLFEASDPPALETFLVRSLIDAPKPGLLLITRHPEGHAQNLLKNIQFSYFLSERS